MTKQCEGQWVERLPCQWRYRCSSACISSQLMRVCWTDDVCHSWVGIWMHAHGSGSTVASTAASWQRSSYLCRRRDITIRYTQMLIASQ